MGRTLWIGGALFTAGMAVGGAVGWMAGGAGTEFAPPGPTHAVDTSNASEAVRSVSPEPDANTPVSTTSTDPANGTSERAIGGRSDRTRRTARRERESTTKPDGIAGPTNSAPIGMPPQGFVQPGDPDFARFVLDAYTRSGGASPDADRRAALLAEARTQSNRALNVAVRRHASHASRLEKQDELTSPAEVVLQVQAGGATEVRMTEWLGSRQTTTLAAAEFDTTTPTGPQIVPAQAFRSGGLVPPGRVFVVEEIVLDAFLGSSARAGGVGLEMPVRKGVRRGGGFSIDSASGRLAGTLRGRLLVHPLEEERVRLHVSQGKATVRLRGRLVTTAEAEGFELTAPALVEEGRLGFLAPSGSITCQFASGRSSIDVPLSGPGRTRAERVAVDTDLFHAAAAEGGRGRFWVRDGGHPPPGERMVVTRVEHRTRFRNEGRGNGYVRFSIGRKNVSQVRQDKPETHTGAWTGEIDVRSRDFRNLSLKAYGEVTGEVILHYRLEAD